MHPEPDKESNEIRQAIMRLFDGELTQPEFEELAVRLRNDPEVRATYFAAASLETHLAHAFAPPLSRAGGPRSAQSTMARKNAKWALGIASAAALVLVAVLGVIEMRQPEPFQASIRVADNTRWSVDGPAGTALQPGTRILLDQGAAELSLPGAVRALVEAPAALTLIDERTLAMDHGSAYFEVSSPEGRGFTVLTPFQRIVDLGTAFGVNARNGREQIALRVFEGRVQVQGLDGEPGETIPAGQAVLLDGPRVTGRADDDRNTFLRTLPPEVRTVLDEDFESGLGPLRDYAVLIDPRAIRDRDGDYFPGIRDHKTWNFSTGAALSNLLPVRNSGFEDDGGLRNKGAAVAHWHKAGSAWGWGVDRQREGLVPTEGDFFGRVFPGHSFSQVLGEPIAAGTTYVLLVDVGLADSAATLTLFGSETGPANPLATRTVSTDGTLWQRNQTVVYTATAADATGQSLGIALAAGAGRFAAFDRVRLGVVDYTDSTSPTPPGTPASGMTPGEGPATGETSAVGPIPLSLHPPDDADQAIPGGVLTISFDRPIELGTGRILLRNITDWTVTDIAVGGPRTTIHGSRLTILPPGDLADGELSMGRISGWESRGWTGLFNPAGDGTRYTAPDLRDSNRSRGVVGNMNGPVMATFDHCGPNSWIRRSLGTITPNTRYTVSIAVGVRGPRTAATFDGYTFTLTSGNTTLAQLTSNTPPGPPDTVSTVAFSWDSPANPTITSKAPLSLVIAPNQASKESPGYLDFDHVRVTASPSEPSQ